MPLREGRRPQIKEVEILKHKKIMILALTLLLLTALCCTSALAAGGDVAGAAEQTWNEAATQIKSVVEKVVFPALDMILAIAFFVKLGGAYFDFRQRGQFEWTGPAILFAVRVKPVMRLKNSVYRERK